MGRRPLVVALPPAVLARAIRQQDQRPAACRTFYRRAKSPEAVCHSDGSRRQGSWRDPHVPLAPGLVPPVPPLLPPPPVPPVPALLWGFDGSVVAGGLLAFGEWVGFSLAGPAGDPTGAAAEGTRVVTLG